MLRELTQVFRVMRVSTGRNGEKQIASVNLLVTVWLILAPLQLVASQTASMQVVGGDNVQEVSLGTVFNMTCQYTGVMNFKQAMPNPSMVWEKNNRCDAANDDFTIYSTRGDGVPLKPGYLVSPAVLPSDDSSGSFSLTVSSIVPSGCSTFNYTCKMTFVLRPRTPVTIMASKAVTLVAPAQIQSITEDSIIRSNESFALKCNATGIPQPQIVWSRKDGGALPASVGGGLSYESSDGTLVISGTMKEHTGTYICTAKNKHAGPITREVHVTVLYKPSVDVEAVIVYQKEGYHTELVCTVDAFPNVTSWQWTDGSKPLNNTRYTELFDALGSPPTTRLTIEPVMKEDLGRDFCCSFSNDIGSDQRCIKLVGSDKAIPVHGKKPRYVELTSSAPHMTGLQLCTWIGSLGGLRFVIH